MRKFNGTEQQRLIKNDKFTKFIFLSIAKSKRTLCKTIVVALFHRKTDYNNFHYEFTKYFFKGQFLTKWLILLLYDDLDTKINQYKKQQICFQIKHRNLAILNYSFKIFEVPNC